MGPAGAGTLSFQNLVELLLPLTAGAAAHAVERLASLPSFSAAALCLVSLIEPSVISAGWACPLNACMTPAFLLYNCRYPHD